MSKKTTFIKKIKNKTIPTENIYEEIVDVGKRKLAISTDEDRDSGKSSSNSDSGIGGGIARNKGDISIKTATKVDSSVAVIALPKPILQ